jgi:hypothetical protein
MRQITCDEKFMHVMDELICPLPIIEEQLGWSGEQLIRAHHYGIDPRTGLLRTDLTSRLHDVKAIKTWLPLETVAQECYVMLYLDDADFHNERAYIEGRPNTVPAAHLRPTEISDLLPRDQWPPGEVYEEWSKCSRSFYDKMRRDTRTSFWLNCLIDGDEEVVHRCWDQLPPLLAWKYPAVSCKVAVVKSD